MLQAHGQIKKITHTHRYEMTGQGQFTITALLSVLNATVRLARDSDAERQGEGWTVGICFSKCFPACHL